MAGRSPAAVEGVSEPSKGAEDKSAAAFPLHFTLGSQIKLSSGELRRVQELKTEDFLNSAVDLSGDVQIANSTVIYLQNDATSSRPSQSTSGGAKKMTSGVISFAVGDGMSKVRRRRVYCYSR